MDMMDTIYKIKLQEFEKKYHNILVDTFKKLNSVWKGYPIRYNKKISLDYTSFVRYCYRISDK